MLKLRVGAAFSRQLLAKGRAFPARALGLQKRRFGSQQNQQQQQQHDDDQKQQQQNDHQGNNNTHNNNNNNNNSNSGGTKTDVLGLAVTAVLGFGVCGLGVWQMQRKTWKEDMIVSRTAQLSQPSVPIATLFQEDEDIDVTYRPVEMTGVLDYANEVYVGPRQPPAHEAKKLGRSTSGYFVITPMTLSDGSTILINRGWASKQDVNTPGTLLEEVSGDTVVSLTGIIKHGEEVLTSASTGTNTLSDTGRPIFWILDADEVAEAAHMHIQPGSAPLIVEAVGPLATRLIRKDVASYVDFYTTPEVHTAYALSWFALSGALFAIGHRRFRSKK
jgi:surfeit locus 1 family protein